MRMINSQLKRPPGALGIFLHHGKKEQYNVLISGQWGRRSSGEADCGGWAHPPAKS
jgi:hypothetical protein